MANETEKKTLTMNDPVTPAELQRLAELQKRRYDIAETLLELKQEEVRLLVQARVVDDERNSLFAKIVTDRGLPAGSPVEIDAQTGRVQSLSAQQGPDTTSETP
jgi:hypothetical protein